MKTKKAPRLYEWNKDRTECRPMDPKKAARFYKRDQARRAAEESPLSDLEAALESIHEVTMKGAERPTNAVKPKVKRVLKRKP